MAIKNSNILNFETGFNNSRNYNDLSIKQKIYHNILSLVRHIGLRFVPAYYIHGMDIYLQKNKDLIGCELGCGQGIDSYIMLSTINIKKLYCIDPYTSCSRLKLKKKVTNLLKKFGDKIEIIDDYDYNVINMFKDDSLDFVMINSATEYKSLMRTLNDWYFKVKTRGVIGGIYWDMNHPDVSYSINEFVKNNTIDKIFKGNLNDWFFIKNNIKPCNRR